ncbi:MAG TPA: bifunctional hydroxymethylpyrimidine kinase/phosphomethylpyrimidine kinase [Smithella sp.]|nr:bifunctional hydroxymethylpyrimidine kinase/phosphomethylpyrimidine kinase [Smithella sp.]
MEPVKVICVGGSDSSGGAGIQADLKALSARGCWGLSVISAVTAQNTKGVFGVYPVTPAFVGRQLDIVLKDINVHALKTGMLPTAEIVGVVAKIIKKYKIANVVVDPVMTAKGGKALMSRKARTALMKNLLPLAFAVTPNIPEAEILSGMKITSLPLMKEAAVKIHKMGVKNVLIKGGHLPAQKLSGAVDVLYDGSFYEFSSPRIKSRDTHGTGCTFASALAAGIAGGMGIVEAAWQAKIMITAAIENAVKPGKGYGSVNVFGKNILTKEK